VTSEPDPSARVDSTVVFGMSGVPAAEVPVALRAGHACLSLTVVVLAPDEEAVLGE